jgi:hypothetical protein
MLTHTTKTSPQGIEIEYINLHSMVIPTEKELAQYRLELRLDLECRGRAVRRIDPMRTWPVSD